MAEYVMHCYEDDETTVCYLPLGHEGPHEFEPEHSPPEASSTDSQHDADPPSVAADRSTDDG